MNKTKTTIRIEKKTLTNVKKKVLPKLNISYNERIKQLLEKYKEKK